MTTKIPFNGKQYDSPDDMPLEVREVYERAMATLKNGEQMVC